MNQYQKLEFEKLKYLLEGKTILRIDEPNAPEAICKFVLNDDTSFRLHATELGFWIEESAEGNYPSLDILIKDISHHMFFDLGWNSQITIAKMHDKFIFSDKNKDFVIMENRLSDVEKKILNSDIGIDLLKEAIPTGDFWKMMFCSKNEDCPPEFYMQ